jgi:hypothetical protein
MLPASKSAVPGRRLISLLLFVAILGVSFQYQFDGVSGSGIASVGKIKAKTIRSQFGDAREMGLIGIWQDQLKTLDQTYLRIDYRQNLLVWPVVATKSSRSPPFTTSP